MSDIQRLRDILQKKQNEVSKLQGKEEVILAELNEQGFDSFKTLEEDLTILDEEIEQNEDILAEKIAEFKETYAALLEGE